MKTRVLLLVILASSAMTSGCVGPTGGTAFGVNLSTGPNGEILLVNPDSASEDFEMEAAFEGTLALSGGNCIIGKTAQGQESIMVFPAKTRFTGDAPLTLEVDGRPIEVDTPVTFGGGFLSGGQLEKLLEDVPEECRRAETFYVQTVQ